MKRGGGERSSRVDDRTSVVDGEPVLLFCCWNRVVTTVRIVVDGNLRRSIITTPGCSRRARPRARPSARGTRRPCTPASTARDWRRFSRLKPSPTASRRLRGARRRDRSPGKNSTRRLAASAAADVVKRLRGDSCRGVLSQLRELPAHALGVVVPAEPLHRRGARRARLLRPRLRVLSTIALTRRDRAQGVHLRAPRLAS